MEDFKRIVKMKTGGSVSKAIAAYEKRERKTEGSADIAQDKKIVKKAIAMHDKQEHKGEKTDLSKLKKGGRAKKAVGTVKKFEKASGQYGAKKTAADKKNIADAKKFKCGGKVKKAAGGSIIDSIKSVGSELKNNILGTPEQNRIAQEQMDKQAKSGSKLAKFFGGKADTESAPVDKCKGGKIKKYAAGGSIDDDVRSRAMKWLEAGSPEQAAAPSAPVKRSRPKKAAKLAMPDYSNEEAERMGLNEKGAIPVVSEEERNRESASLANKYPAPKFSAAREVGVSQPSGIPEYAKSAMGYKRGGKACK